MRALDIPDARHLYAMRWDLACLPLDGPLITGSMRVLKGVHTSARDVFSLAFLCKHTTQMHGQSREKI